MNNLPAQLSSPSSNTTINLLTFDVHAIDALAKDVVSKAMNTSRMQSKKSKI